MVVDGSTFVRRVHVFFKLLQEDAYPNAITLARACGCSKNTAQRTIYRLRDEYLVPFDYDHTRRGYFLLDKNYNLPSFLPPGKDELTALLLARDLVSSLDAEDLNKNLDALWDQFATTNSAVSRDLSPLTEVFSSDLTVVGDLADQGLLQYVSAAKAGESVRLVYKSPWRHKQEKSYTGRIERVHFSDGSLYLLFASSDGSRRVLNCSFIREFEILDHDLEVSGESDSADSPKGANWLEGFGIWADEEVEDVEIRISPPASEYYAKQRWHSDQEDSWEGDILVRRIKSMLSPELERRILSLGKYLCGVKPESLRTRVYEQAKMLVEALR